MERGPFLNLKVAATLQLMAASEFQDNWAANNRGSQLAYNFLLK